MYAKVETDDDGETIDQTDSGRAGASPTTFINRPAR